MDAGGCSRSSLPTRITPEQLSSELERTPQTRIAGTLRDPRSISVTSTVEGPLLKIRADYWSQEYIP
ncbi:hypothetical protein C5C49_15130 [Rathayibacter sp. AY1E2]|nr:hypothetical protein C5C49_15130 [Rathayibacter sp. AY1E2]